MVEIIQAIGQYVVLPVCIMVAVIFAIRAL